MSDPSVLEPANGVRLWVEQGAVHLIAINPRFRDAVELGEHEVKAVIAALQSLSERIDRADRCFATAKSSC